MSVSISVTKQVTCRHQVLGKNWESVANDEVDAAPGDVAIDQKPCGSKCGDGRVRSLGSCLSDELEDHSVTFCRFMQQPIVRAGNRNRQGINLVSKRGEERKKWCILRQ